MSGGRGGIGWQGGLWWAARGSGLMWWGGAWIVVEVSQLWQMVEAES